MKVTKLHKLFGILIATSALGAKGLSCGPCEDSVVVTPVLPPSSDGGVEPGDAGDWLAEECIRKCGHGLCEPQTAPLADGGVAYSIQCTTSGDCVGGRMPARSASEASSMREEHFLARMAYLEEASITAFRDLRKDLHALGAPRKLLRRASRAKRDEMRHAKRMRALAVRAQEPMGEVLLHPAKRLSLEELATQNAVEGCVREMFGALLAAYQAMHAEDQEARTVMCEIAKEEAEHAALALDIHQWAMKRLDGRARERVQEARRRAVMQLGRRREGELGARYRARYGLPSAREMEVLGRAMACAFGGALACSPSPHRSNRLQQIPWPDAVLCDCEDVGRHFA